MRVGFSIGNKLRIEKEYIHIEKTVALWYCQINCSTEKEHIHIEKSFAL